MWKRLHWKLFQKLITSPNISIKEPPYTLLLRFCRVSLQKSKFQIQHNNRPKKHEKYVPGNFRLTFYRRKRKANLLLIRLLHGLQDTLSDTIPFPNKFAFTFTAYAIPVSGWPNIRRIVQQYQFRFHPISKILFISCAIAYRIRCL